MARIEERRPKPTFGDCSLDSKPTKQVSNGARKAKQPTSKARSKDEARTVKDALHASDGPILNTKLLLLLLLPPLLPLVRSGRYLLSAFMNTADGLSSGVNSRPKQSARILRLSTLSASELHSTTEGTAVSGEQSIQEFARSAWEKFTNRWDI